MSRGERAIALTLTAALAGAVASGAIPAAASAAPALVIERPANGSATNDRTPEIAGTTTGIGAVTVNVYRGPSAEGEPEQSPSDALALGGSWSVTPASLEDGTYTAVAEQTDVSELGETGSSAPVTFTVDTEAPAVTLSALGSHTNDPTPTLSGAAGEAPGDDQTVSVTIYEGGVVGGNVVASQGVSRSAGSWSYVPPRLGEGTYTAQATQSDAAGNVGKSAARTFTVDTTAPAVTLDPVSSPTSDATPNLKGSGGEAAGDDGSVSVTIYEGSAPGPGIAASASAGVSGGSWSYSPPRLPDGTYTAVATQGDAAGNLGTSSPVTFTVDTSAPAVTLNPIPSPSNDSTPTLSGSAGTAAGDDPAVSVAIYEGTSAGGEAIAGGSASVSEGSWSYGAPHLADGTYTAQASQSDAAGNVTRSAAHTFTIDTSAPAVGLSNPAAGAFLGTAKPTFSGAAGSQSGDSETVTLEIYAGPSASGAPDKTVAVARSGASWTTGSSGPSLADGTYTARATQSDGAGNLGVSPAHTFTIRTKTPVVTLTAPATPTRDSTPTFTGSADTSEGDSQAITVKVYLGTAPSGTPVREGTAAAVGGVWSFGPVAPLSDGTYTALAEQSDQAGNTGTSAPATFTIDTTAPAVSLKAVHTPGNDPTPTLEGRAGTAAGDSANVSVTVYAGASVGGHEVSSGTFSASGGEWSFTTGSLPDGTYTAQAVQSDAAGNVGESAASTFVIDTTAPVVTLAPIQSPANDPTPSLGGGAGTAPNDQAGIEVRIYEGASTGGRLAATASATGSGGGWATTAPHLADGTYTAQALQRDAAGNTGFSATRTFVIDTAPPHVTLDSPALRSNNTKPSFTGTASDTTPVTVNIYKGETASGTPAASATAAGTGGGWTSSQASPALLDGQYTAVASQPSSLGNPTGQSAPVTFTVDTRAPTVILNQPASPSNNRKPLFSGSASEAGTVTVRVYEGTSTSGTPFATATANAIGGAWTSGQLSRELGTGEHTYTATASEKGVLGNPEGTSTPVSFVVNTNKPNVSLNALTSPSNDATPSFGGTASDTTEVTVRIKAAASGKEVAMAKGPAGAGRWSSGPASPALADGEYVATAEQPSSLGNPVGMSNQVAFTVDTSPPAVSIAPLKSPTNDPTPPLSGGAGTASGDEKVVSVTIYSGTSVGGSVVASSTSVPVVSGHWQYVPSNLADGTYTAQAQQGDSAGNTGASAPVTFAVDTQPPTVTLEKQPLRSSNTRPSFTGSASETTQVTVKIYLGTSAKGAPVATAIAAGTGGAWTSTSASPELASGKYTATATQTDAAGNSATSSEVNFTIDTQAPSLKITQLSSPINTTTPSFSGTTSDTTPVTIRVYAGTSAVPPPVAEATALETGGAWTSAPVSPPLPDGRYIAVATQPSSLPGNHEAVTGEFPFVVDTLAPRVTLGTIGPASPAGSQSVGGSAGTLEGDRPVVTVLVFAGPGLGEGRAPVRDIGVGVSGGSWATTIVGLAPGSYTARAQQADAAGNLGLSAPISFSIPQASAAGATHAAPSASFSWFPSTPHVGERVSLVSSSTGSSALTAFAWDLAGNGSFIAGTSVLSTTFSTAGPHLVHLRVTDAAGLSSVATGTIPVAGARAALMQPFPLVRIVTTRTASGIRLSVLVVQAPPGARVTVRCRGRGCPLRSQSRLARAAGKSRVASIEFRRFERSLRPGTVLEIRVTKQGEIGKYTSLAIHRRGAHRSDQCLPPGGLKPMRCPTQ